MVVTIKQVWLIWELTMLGVTGLWLCGIGDEAIIRSVGGQVPLCLSLTVLAWIKR